MSAPLTSWQIGWFWSQHTHTRTRRGPGEWSVLSAGSAAEGLGPKHSGRWIKHSWSLTPNTLWDQQEVRRCIGDQNHIGPVNIRQAAGPRSDPVIRGFQQIWGRMDHRGVLVDPPTTAISLTNWSLVSVQFIYTEPEGPIESVYFSQVYSGESNKLFKISFNDFIHLSLYVSTQSVLFHLVQLQISTSSVH